MVIDKISLIKLIKGQKKKLTAHGVRRIGIFGSFVNNNAHKDSDVDVLVEFKKGQKNFDNFIFLAFTLENLFGRKVEIVTPESLNVYIAPYILKEVEYVSLTN